MTDKYRQGKKRKKEEKKQYINLYGPLSNITQVEKAKFNMKPERKSTEIFRLQE